MTAKKKMTPELYKKIQIVLTDTTRPVSERRNELVQHLIQGGFIIQKQEPTMVTALLQKPRFNIISFLFWSLLWLIPGIIYLIFHAMKRDEVKQFVLVE